MFASVWDCLTVGLLDLRTLLLGHKGHEDITSSTYLAILFLSDCNAQLNAPTITNI